MLVEQSEIDFADTSVEGENTDVVGLSPSKKNKNPTPPLGSSRVQVSDLGIESKQADVYASALVLGGGTIAELARAANIERTGIYYHVDQMVNRGLLKTSRRGQRIIYLPTDPTKLKEILFQ